MGLVTVSEYARMRGLNKSTVSRQLHKVIPNRGTDAKPMIDVDEADAARAKHVNPLKARQGATAVALGNAIPGAVRPSDAVSSDDQETASFPPGDLVDRAVDAAARGSSGFGPDPRGPSDYANIASVAKFWQAQQIKQRALKEAGQLTPTADVTMEQTTVARRWRDRLMGAPREWAPVLYATMISGATETQILVKLDEMVRRLVASFAEEARAEVEHDDADDRLEPGQPDDAAGDFVGEEGGVDGLGEGA